MPESSGGKIAVAPLVIPIGVTAGVLDIFVVHPIYMLPEATTDTYETLWEGYYDKLNAEYYSYAGWAPVGAVLTPVVFGGLWLAYSSLDMGDEDEPSPPEEIPVSLEKALAQSKPTLINRWLLKNQHNSEDRSVAIRENYSRFAKNVTFRGNAIYYLGAPKRIAANEQFLSDLYMKDREPVALHVLAGIKSTKLSQALLDKIFSPGTNAIETKQLIDALYRINNKEMIRRFIEKMRTR